MGAADRPARTRRSLRCRRSWTRRSPTARAACRPGSSSCPVDWPRCRKLGALATTVGRRGGLVASHIRNRDRHFEAAVEELLTATRVGEAKLQLSHLMVKPGHARGAWGARRRADGDRPRRGPGRGRGMIPYDTGPGLATGFLPRALAGRHAGAAARARELRAHSDRLRPLLAVRGHGRVGSVEPRLQPGASRTGLAGASTSSPPSSGWSRSTCCSRS